MKVLIDGHMLGENESGNERYIANLYPELSKLTQTYLYHPRNHKPKNKAKAKLIKATAKNDLSRILFDLPAVARKIGVDIVHSTYIAPPMSVGKSVITVHDFSFKKYPGDFSKRELFIFTHLLPITMKKTSAIIVPSEFSKKELSKYYPNHVDKTFVTREAASKDFSPVSKKKATKLAESKFGIKSPFLLVFSSKYQRKNVKKTIQAFEKIKKKNDLRLALVGTGVKGLKQEGIYTLGYLKDSDLNILYNASVALLYPSLYEGFGLPILEAMRTKTPVICSDIPVHREIAEKAALYVKPDSVKSMVEAMEKILEDKKLRSKLIKEGKKVEKGYSWEKTAKQTLEAYEFALKN